MQNRNRIARRAAEIAQDARLGGRADRPAGQHMGAGLAACSWLITAIIWLFISALAFLLAFMVVYLWQLFHRRP
jgi:hypothetical protein